ncbi:piggyBac transposable element-derived protein 4-like [Acyrthosiphon pisum]|uniref:PiggyBac transposable element-derived protein domain-containing protein n=1 Tax=Acyrthosiphon pisum TaxID=7029 RepID=A0A8R1X0T6_ACYPI|nr:piggyBac transposable element-derived protein 4-like [Acyrthosiphon pisum]|eukprot:XP_008178754.1 PREDICTED: piggyBac transposable element-derived protein 4-like [Acyrthosiphon pisum]
MHHSSTIDESTKEIKKPEIITFYNCTKGAVDTMDKKTENYTVARKSCRWPLTVFYSILNIAGLNSQIIFQENTNIKMSRLNFLKTLSRQLMEEQLKYRLTIDVLPKTIKLRLKQYGTKTNEAAGTSQRVRASGRCAFCERAKDRKSNLWLHKPVCTNFARLICRDHIIETFTGLFYRYVIKKPI